jgi:hypothetical protein
MRYQEFTKPLITRLYYGSSSSLSNLYESKEGKNTHLEHLEDNIFNKGYPGAKEAINYLYSLHEMLEGHSRKSVNITTKWDGAPAVICGTDPETGKFFVGTKGAFAKTPKINFTNADIDNNHPSEGLREKLKAALLHLRKLNWSGTVAQGDLLFTKGDVKTASIGGEEYIVFKPNTITYAVPANSDLAKQILSADIGIVFHTEYVGGPTLADTNARYGFDSDRLGSASGVWHRDATIRDLSGTITFTAEESAHIMAAISAADGYLKQIDANTFSWLQRGTEQVGSDFIVQLKAHANAQVRKGSFDEPTKFAQGFVQRYIEYMTKVIEKYKTDAKRTEATEKMVQGVQFIKQNIAEVVAVYDLYLKLMEAKNKIVTKLAQIKQMDTFVEENGEYVVTGEEGFVAVDRMGGALKLVDRLEFSRLNFGSGKPGA